MKAEFVHVLLRARDFQQRRELDRIVEWWRGGAPGVCALIGLGGVGKTALVDRFLRMLPGVTADSVTPPNKATLDAPARVFVFSFYDAPRAEELLDRLVEWLSGAEPASPPRNVSLAEVFGALKRMKGRLLLVLDGLERVQDDGTAGGAFGDILSPTLRNLLTRVASGVLPKISVLATSRFPIASLAETGSSCHCEIPVEELEESAALALLEQRGVKGSAAQRLRILERWGRHALTIDLVAGYIEHFGDGNPETSIVLESSEVLEQMMLAEPLPARRRVLKQELRFTRIARAYREQLTRTAPEALELMKRVAMFRNGVRMETLAAMQLQPPAEAKPTRDHWASLLAMLRQPKKPTTVESLWRRMMRQVYSGRNVRDAERRLDRPLALLRHLRLIERTPRDGVVAHPAVRDGFLRDVSPEAIKRAHQDARSALEPLLLSGLGGVPGVTLLGPDLEKFEEIIYHTIEAGEVDEALEQYFARAGGFLSIGFEQAAYERGNRVCRLFFDGGGSDVAPTRLTGSREGEVLNEWGLYLTELGDLARAQVCFEKAKVHALRRSRLHEAAIAGRNLALVLASLGRLPAARAAARKALVGFEHAGVESRTRARYGCIPDFELDDLLAKLALSSRRAHGRTTDQAIEVEMPLDDLIRAGRLREAELQATLIMEGATLYFGEGTNLSRARCLLVRAELHMKHGRFDEAVADWSEASTWTSAHDQRALQTRALLTRARIASCFNSPDAERETEECLEEGLRLAAESGFGILFLDLLLEQAKRRLASGDVKSAHALASSVLFGASRDPSTVPSQRIFRPGPGAAPMLAATHPECGYLWGVDEARKICDGSTVEVAATSSTDADPDTIFVSYAREDSVWLNELLDTLSPAVRRGELKIWHDREVQPGESWREMIERAIAKSRVAVLLVTRNFLASDFIMDDELPLILKRAREGALRIIWVPVGAALYESTPLAELQAASDVKRPLELLPPTEKAAVFVEIARAVLNAISRH